MNIEQLTENELLLINRFLAYYQKNEISNECLVQFIEVIGSLLNAETISAYAKRNRKSYNGVKKCRNIRKMLGVKFVIDNE